MKWITHEKHRELMSKGYSFDHILILKELDEGREIEMEDAKVAILHQSLVRKGLLFETENKLTTIGKELLIFINSKDSKKIVKPKVASSEFDLWWSEFPGTDSFVYRGKTFTGSRSLRAAKDDCKVKFNKILLEGEYSVTQMIEALKLDIFLKKEKSYQTSSNKLSFLQNSATYLHQRSFEPFIELLTTGVKIEETKSMGGGGTDI